jgi:hypothetical protein
MDLASLRSAAHRLDADLAAVRRAAERGAAVCRLGGPAGAGVWSADPALVADAVLLARPRSADVAAMGRRGAAVPHPQVVELAAGLGIALRCGGSTIEPGGAPVHAVVADLRSVVVEFSSPELAGRSRDELLAAGVAAHLLRSPSGRHLVAVCGPGAAPGTRPRPPGRLTPMRLVTELRGGQLRNHLAADEPTARALAAHLHHAVRRALTGPLAAAG